MNPLADKALKARQDAANLTQDAIAALLTEQKAIAEQLRALGYIEGQKTPTKKEPKTDAQKHCKICQQYGHDGRFHRSDKAKPPAPPAAPPKPPAPAAAK
jgi:hypothetical protein